MMLFNIEPVSSFIHGSVGWATVCLASWILAVILISDFCRLRGLGGPLLAKYSNLWRLYKTYQGDMHHDLIALHRRYGNAVRIGPNCVSLAGIEAKSAIYGISGPKFSKSDFYVPFQASIANKTYQNLFNTTDETFHAAIKRPVSRAYAMSTLLEYESFVDATTQNLLSQLSRRHAVPFEGQRSSVCALDKWLGYYAYDVIGEITFSRSFGFLDCGPDADDTISTLRLPRAAIAVCQMPILDWLVLKPLRRWARHIPTSAVVSFTIARINDRALQVEKQPSDRRDMLSRFSDAREMFPEIVNELRILSYATSNVNAGADTTAITLRAVFYYLLKHPATMQTLEQEIFSAAQAGALSKPCVSWVEAQKLPYLDAVIKEALRIHPAVGLMLERIVPTEGVTIHGRHYNAGTLLGISPWVMGRDKSIYGDDADHWRPERWLECDAAQLSRMVGASLAFGGGTRTCIGKNISLLEMYKLIPAIVQRFTLALANPAEEWRTENQFLVFQEGLDVTVQERGPSLITQ